METMVHGHFSPDCGAGYYSQQQQGDGYDGICHIHLYFELESEDGIIDREDRDALPPFSYHHADTPVCDEYNC